MPKHVVNFRHYEFFIMLILEAYALNSRIIFIVPFNNKRPYLNILQLTWKRYSAIKEHFVTVCSFLCPAISPIWTRKVSVLFLSIVRQISLSTKVKPVCMFTPIPWCDCALILFWEFGIHQHVFWQKLRASFATQKHQFVFKISLP